MKFIVLSTAFLFVSALAALRAKKGRENLAKLEAGQMCMHCNGTDVQQTDKGVQCRTCGQTTSWAFISSSSPSELDMNKLNEPDVRRPWE